VLKGYIPAVCLLYGTFIPPNGYSRTYLLIMYIGLTCGLGEHVVNVSKPDLRKFNIVSDPLEFSLYYP